MYGNYGGLCQEKVRAEPGVVAPCFAAASPRGVLGSLCRGVSLPRCVSWLSVSLSPCLGSGSGSGSSRLSPPARSSSGGASAGSGSGSASIVSTERGLAEAPRAVAPLDDSGSSASVIRRAALTASELDADLSLPRYLAVSLPLCAALPLRSRPSHSAGLLPLGLSGCLVLPVSLSPQQRQSVRLTKRQVHWTDTQEPREKGELTLGSDT